MLFLIVLKLVFVVRFVKENMIMIRFIINKIIYMYYINDFVINFINFYFNDFILLIVNFKLRVKVIVLCKDLLLY